MGGTDPEAIAADAASFRMLDGKTFQRATRAVIIQKAPDGAKGRG
jgi:hypothetical protein